MLSRHEKAILKDLESVQQSKKRKFFIDVSCWFISVIGFFIILGINFQNSLSIFGAALCGGIIGSRIEKMYFRKILALTVKLYHLNKKEA